MPVLAVCRATLSLAASSQTLCQCSLFPVPSCCYLRSSAPVPTCVTQDRPDSISLGLPARHSTQDVSGPSHALTSSVIASLQLLSCGRVANSCQYRFVPFITVHLPSPVFRHKHLYCAVWPCRGSVGQSPSSHRLTPVLSQAMWD